MSHQGAALQSYNNELVKCKLCYLFLKGNSPMADIDFRVWSIRPSHNEVGWLVPCLVTFPSKIIPRKLWNDPVPIIYWGQAMSDLVGNSNLATVNELARPWLGKQTAVLENKPLSWKGNHCFWKQTTVLENKTLSWIGNYCLVWNCSNQCASIYFLHKHCFIIIVFYSSISW